MVDTLLLCASEDLELHDGTPGREYLMNVQLMESLITYPHSDVIDG